MEAIRGAVLAVIAASLACAMMNAVLPGNMAKDAIQFLCGLFVLYTLLSYGKKLELPIREQPVRDILSDAQDEADAAAENAKKELAKVIKAGCETYILDKAAAMGVAIEPEVSVSDDDLPLPVRVILRGAVMPDQKSSLSEMIAEDLGIAKEDQHWTG